MKDNHIISMLESGPFSSLSESELEAIRAHVAGCSDCLRAFEAAQISALLVKERALEEVLPSPFFQTRVMAALRERQAVAETPASSFRRLWKATGALVSGMAATVTALAVLTLFAPGSQPTTATQEMTTAFNSYSAEEVIFAQDGLPEERMSYGQVLTTIYGADEDR